MTNDEVRAKARASLDIKKGRVAPKRETIPKTNIEKQNVSELLKDEEVVQERKPIKLKKKAKEVLEERGFDPIVELILMHDKYKSLLNIELLKEKPSSMTLTALINAQQKCVTELIRYGYAREPESGLLGDTVIPNISINMPADYGKHKSGRILRAVSNE